MNLKVLLFFALAFVVGSVVVYLLFPFYEGLPLLSSAMAGGCLTVAVLIQTMKRADAAKKALDQKKEAIVQKTFSDGITHLGHESESVILGGIHSLLDLAKENNDYRPMVLKILCTHIKTTTAAEEYRKKHPKQPSTTIQILLNSLFKDEEYNIFTVDPAEKNYRVDLSGAYLAGSELSGARLRGSNLAESQLQRADLRGAQLQGADLRGAQLQGADLITAQLQRAKLTKAQLQGAYLIEAQLQRADLVGTQLQGAFLIEAQLQGAFLTGAQLQGADLKGTHLQRAFLTEAQLQDTLLIQAQLQGALLRKTQLQGADLTRAQLQGAYLHKAQLQDTKLRQTEMQGAYMYQTELPHETQMGGSNLRGGYSLTFELTPLKFQARIKNRIGRDSELNGAVFNKEAEGPEAFQDKGPAITGSYTKEEADQWIKEYEEALDWEKDKG